MSKLAKVFSPQPKGPEPKRVIPDADTSSGAELRRRGGLRTKQRKTTVLSDGLGG